MDNKELKDFERLIDETYKTKHSFISLIRLLDATEGVTYIASGTARAVYKVNDDKVLKIAKNPKGIAQNQTEADWGLKNYGVAAEWYDVSDEGLWIESELCSKVKITDFKKELGFTFAYFCDCLRYYYFSNKNMHHYKPDGYDETWDNEFIRPYYEYLGDFGVPVGDLTRISSYGRNHEGEIVLVDTGLSEDVYRNYY
jgi:hypothetical protein